MDAYEPFHCCCLSGIKRLDNHWLLWGRPQSRFPLQGMVGPHWRIGAWTFLSIPAGTAAWGCLILFGAPDDGADTVRQFVVAIGAAIAVVTMALYLCTACTDPGIVFRHTAPPVRASLPGHQQHRSGGGGGRGAVEPPAGAGTPVRPAVAAAAPAAPAASASTGGKGGSTEVNEEVEKAAGAWGSEDVEAQQILDILTEDYTQGVLSQAAGPVGSGAAVAGAGAGTGLPPDRCIAAADAGSSAVVDMRNVPPPEGPPTLTPPRAYPAQQHQQHQGVASTGAGAAGATVCGRCQIERPPGAIHCTQCGVCVVKLDHHCPFMGQCVGRKTLVPFYLFVVAVWSLIVYVLLVVGYLVVAIVYHGL